MNRIKVGTTLDWLGAVYQIRAIKTDLGDVRLEGKGGVERTIDIEELYNLIAAGDIRLPGTTIPQVHRITSETEREEADFRKSLVDLVNSLQRKRSTCHEIAEAIENFCSLKHRKRPSDRTIKNYQRRYRKFGFDGLVPNFSGRGGSGWRKKYAVKEIAEKFLIDSFLKDDRLNLSVASKLIAEEARQQSGLVGGETVSRKTLSRMLLKLPSALQRGGRLDPRTYALANRQAIKCYDVKQPFERVEVDAKTIDVYCRDELGEVHTQATLYAMVCACTSYPVGIYVTAGKPSEYTLFKLLEFFYSPKDAAFKKKFGIATDWVSPCSIMTLVFDNASENHSDLVIDLVRKVGTQAEFARSARGDDKPHVESFFKAVDDGVIKLMPGVNRSNDPRVKNRHARAISEACLTVDDIYQRIVQFVADVYIHQPRLKLGFRHGQQMSINTAMSEAVAKFMPLPPPALETIKRLVLEVNRVRRRFQHYGVDFEGFQYHSSEMAALASSRQIKEVELFYNPEDCTAVYVLRPDGEGLIRLENKMIGVPSISFDAAKKLRSRYRKPLLTGHDYQKAYAQLVQDVMGSKPNRRSIRQNNQQVRERAKLAQKEEIDQQIAKRGGNRKDVSSLLTIDFDGVSPAPRKGARDDE